MAVTISGPKLLGYTVSCSKCGGAFLITPDIKEAKRRANAHATKCDQR